VASKKAITGLISIAPARYGNLPSNRQPTPADRTIVFVDEMTRNFFCKRFAKAAIDLYRRSACAMSPGVFNSLSSTDGSGALVIDDFAAIASIPKLVIAGDHDQLVTQQMSSAIAGSLGA
jgi:hypothetical protein